MSIRQSKSGDTPTSLFTEKIPIQPSYLEGARIVLNHGDTVKFMKTVPPQAVRLIVTSIGPDFTRDATSSRQPIVAARADT